MNVLFLTLVEIHSVEERGLYQDLLRKFRDEGHDVTVVTPVQRSRGISTRKIEKEGVTVLQVRTFNIQKTNVIEKGIGTLAIEYQYMAAIKKHLSSKKFDLVLYSTPPITLVKVIQYIKNRDGAFSYLLLKDIFPQNAVDMRMMIKNGLFHRYFVKKEKELYQVSDSIGCMSEANVKFVLDHHPEVQLSKIEVNPNSIDPSYTSISIEDKETIREKFGLPKGGKIFVYGGNLGKPQGLQFLIDTLAASTHTEAFFLVVGDGTEYKRIAKWFTISKPPNAKLLNKLPKKDYDLLVASCDVGLIFLDRNFRIPNFPSRVLSYLEMGLPVVAATDLNTDIGDILEKHGCGYKVHAGDLDTMLNTIKRLTDEDLSKYGPRCKKLLEDEFHVRHSYQIIMKAIDHV